MQVSSIFWIGFHFFILIMLALDLGIFNRKPHEISAKEALIWSGIWITLALIFNGLVYHWFGEHKAIEFLTGYLIEKSLSVDNIFVFVMIFEYFRIPAQYQHKVLYWGIIGALILRCIFIFAGVAMMEKFHWTIYLFGLFLIYTGFKMFKSKDEGMNPRKNRTISFCKRLMPVTEELHDGKFFIRQDGKNYATPLFLVLMLIEITDVIFAVDSIPAILAITQDRYIVYTSNVFAILGLRSLYFALAHIVNRFIYLHYGLAIVLVFVGCKMVMVDVLKVPTFLSLLFILLVISGSVVLSFMKTRKEN